MRMRSGSSLEWALKRRWTSLRRAAGEAVDHFDAQVRIVGVFDGLFERGAQIALGAFAVFREDERAAVVPAWRFAGGLFAERRQRGGHWWVRIQSIRRRVFTSGWWRARSAMACISFRSACSRCQRRVVEAVLSAAKVAACICAFSSASNASPSHSARSSSASGAVSRPSGCTSVVLLERRLRRSHQGVRQCRATVSRCAFRLRANASVEESRRCCKPTTSKPAAARALPEASA